MHNHKYHDHDHNPELTTWQRDSRKPLPEQKHVERQLWLYVAAAAQEDPGSVERYGLCRTSAKHIAQSDHRKLALLCNSAICSFRLTVNLEELSNAVMSIERRYEVAPLSVIQAEMKSSADPAVEVAINYLSAIKRSAETDGHDLAQIKFGMSGLGVSIISRASLVALRLVAATVSWGISLRYPSDLVVDILTNENSTHCKLSAIQQMIADTDVLPLQPEHVQREKKKHFERFMRGISSSANDAPDESSEICNKGKKLMFYDPLYKKAAQLMRVGFVLEVLKIEIGRNIGDKVFSRIGREQKAAGVVMNRPTSIIPSGRFMVGYPLLIQSSILMLIYTKLAGEKSKLSVDINCLIGALTLVELIKHDANIENWPAVSPTQAYGLAREMRGGSETGEEAYIDSCVSCDIPYFTSIHQGGSSSNPCPFCIVNEKNNKIGIA